VIVLPALTTRTQSGAAAVVPEMPAAATPAAVRYWYAVPFADDTSMSAYADPGVSVSRIITPAFVQAATFWSDATRATISPSPLSG
jgi:hypothetical protein